MFSNLPSYFADKRLEFNCLKSDIFTIRGDSGAHFGAPQGTLMAHHST